LRENLGKEFRFPGGGGWRRLVWLALMLFALVVTAACSGGYENRVEPARSSSVPAPDPEPTKGYVRDWTSEKQPETVPAAERVKEPQAVPAPDSGATRDYIKTWTNEKQPGITPSPDRVKNPEPVSPPSSNDQTDKYIRGDIGD